MTRHSAHDLSASVVSAAGGVVVRPTDVRVQLSESRFPFGRADVTIPLPQGEPVPSYTDWVEQRRNPFTNPAMRTSITGWMTRTGGGAEVTLTRATGVGPPGYPNAYAQVTLTKAGTWWRLRSEALPVTALEEHSFPFWMRGRTGAFHALIIWINAAGSTISETIVSLTTDGTWTLYEVSGTAPDGAVTARVEVSRSQTDIGNWFHATGFSQGTPYFDGSTNPDGLLERTRWLSTPDASPSVLEVREQDSFVLLPDARLEVSNPRAGDARLLLDLRESVGDPVQVSEITFGLGGNMAALTAAFTGDVAAVTAAYATPWNDDLTIVGSAARMNMVLHSREVDHAAGVVRLTAYTDEALAVMYRLVSTQPETSSSLSVRDTVNFALSKIGATLLPGTVDAVIKEPSAIVWEPGVSAWEYIRNVAEAAGLVVRCDGRRRWTLTRRDETRPELVVLDRSIGIVERIDVDAQQYADAVVVRYDWTDPTTGESRTRYDTASQTSTPGTVKLVERRVPYPGRGAAAYWLKRLAARGRAYDITQVNDYSIRPGMQFTAPVPATPTQVGRIETIEWALPAPVMTVTTTGAADAVPGAIDLFPDGIFINDLVGVINDLNPGSEAAE